MPLIEADNLHVSLSGKEILNGLSFAIDQGKSVGLLGPNGSGKTTLLRTISGNLPYKGSLLLNGIPVREWKPRALAREMAFVRQTPAIGFDFTVDEFVRLGRSPHKTWLQGYNPDDLQMVDDALRLVDLKHMQNRSVLSLSGGELQRVFLAQALVQEAGILLLDEPTSNLDVFYQFEFMERIRELVIAGRTVITVYHDLELAARYADFLIILSSGRVVATGSPARILTPSLIASVFRMEVEIHADADGALHIHYLSPLYRPAVFE